MQLKNDMERRLKEEILFQDKNANNYTLKRETDFIWEIPERIFLISKKYFKSGSTVIDMGCGPCVSVINILPNDILRKCRYIGVDISRKMLNYAQKNIPHGKFVQGNIENLDFKDNYAGVILSLGALHHCEDKLNTLRKWIIILKKGGVILLREPTYEAMPKGKGESPLEEGIKIQDLLDFLQTQKVELISLIFFSSPAFHLFNKIMIKIGLSSWQNVKILWYPVVLVDVFLGKIFQSKINFFKGYAFCLVVRKL